MVGSSYIVLFFVFLSAREPSLCFRTNTLPQLDTDHDLEPGRTQLLHELKLSPTNFQKGQRLCVSSHKSRMHSLLPPDLITSVRDLKISVLKETVRKPFPPVAAVFLLW